MAPDVHVVEDDRVLHLAVAIDAHVVAQHRSLHAAARYDAARRNDRIDRHAHAIRIGEHEFHRRILLLPGAQRPALVVQVEDRRNRDQVHVRFVIRVERANVAPVMRLRLALVLEIVGVHPIF